jgi:hypothetical protein
LKIALYIRFEGIERLAVKREIADPLREGFACRVQSSPPPASVGMIIKTPIKYRLNDIIYGMMRHPVPEWERVYSPRFRLMHGKDPPLALLVAFPNEMVLQID